MTTRGVLALVATISACTEANPDYRPPVPPPEGSVAECQIGERRCLNTITQACSGAGRWVNERLCPGLSTCQDGICVPSGPPCGSEADCGPGRACSIFVDPVEKNELGNFCALTVGIKPGLSVCTGDEQCRSGFCLHRGGESICYQACREDFDCPKAPHRCVQISVTVNGVQDQVRSCAN